MRTTQILDRASTGERITIALVVLGLVVEMLSDNFSWEYHPKPMETEDCVELCWSQGLLVQQFGFWDCVCQAAAGAP